MTDLIEQQIREMKLIRSWLTQNVALIDASIAAMEMQSQAVTLMSAPLLNPVQWWIDAATRKHA